MTSIQKTLLSYQDLEYKAFSEKGSPSVDPNSIIGVRVPEIRTLAKTISEKEALEFFKELPHKYNEENLLHGFLIQKIKDYDLAIKCLDTFLPYVNNWAVSDTMIPKIFCKDKYKERLLIDAERWISGETIYQKRFGIDIYMSFFLDDKFFKEEYLHRIASIKSNEYYVNMMIAWYFATALAKQYDTTIKLIESKTLSKWIHNKTIRKAIESFRVSDEHKIYLRTLVIK